MPFVVIFPNYRRTSYVRKYPGLISALKKNSGTYTSPKTLLIWIERLQTAHIYLENLKTETNTHMESLSTHIVQSRRVKSPLVHCSQCKKYLICQASGLYNCLSELVQVLSCHKKHLKSPLTKTSSR